MENPISIYKKEIANLEESLIPFRENISYINEGDNILFEVNDTFYLLKYEDSEIASVHPLHHRVNRYMNVVCVGNLFLPKEEREKHPYTHKDPSKRISEKARIDILGTHKIKFEKDEEFGIYLPSSENHSDLYLTVAVKYADGRIEKTVDFVDITIGDSLISEKLKNITRPQYFERIIVPFLENRPTDLKMPKWKKRGILERMLHRVGTNSFRGKSKKPNYKKFNIIEGYKWLYEATKDLEHGDFVYVGSKEEVYLLGIAKNEDGMPYMQGTYFTSTKPMFFFSNNYLGNMTNQEIEKPLFKGKYPYNCAEYRISDAPGFDGKPFIFTAMGRSQDCKNSMFKGEPDIITGDIDEAIEHFRTTDFTEFEDIVKKYHERIREPAEYISLKPGCRFYY